MDAKQQGAKAKLHCCDAEGATRLVLDDRLEDSGNKSKAIVLHEKTPVGRIAN